MAKPKLSLADLQIKSFVTTLDEAQMHHLKGGAYIIRGRRFTYRTRWTSVDTRSDEAEAIIVRPGEKTSAF
ncbi:MAG: pinensin family lanthipeptide [Lewinellaceae bacterium]|nr:pinensin family lanthipeptide [Lewinellaceae bacterium]